MKIGYIATFVSHNNFRKTELILPIDEHFIPLTSMLHIFLAVGHSPLFTILNEAIHYKI